MSIYLDNAATTPPDPLVLEAMQPFLKEHFGNPSSIHAQGRAARSALEKSRKTIASLLNTSPSEIFFTSGGTESDNMAITGSVLGGGIRKIITTKIEHHAVLHAVEFVRQRGWIDEIVCLHLDSRGHISYDELETHLRKDGESTFVTLMHGNNEIGNLLDIEQVAALCKAYSGVFHTDSVQTIGLYPFNLQKLSVDFLVGSAHKFHGPKGVGLFYCKAGRKPVSLFQGGMQERSLRAGTEHVAGIVGLAKALELAYSGMEEKKKQISRLKTRLAEGLSRSVPGVVFNGDSLSEEKSIYTVLNVGFPRNQVNEMLLFNLDINGISVSGGSACNSGAPIGSHVLDALGADPERAHVRFSLSKYNTEAEIDSVVKVLAGYYKG